MAEAKDVERSFGLSVGTVCGLLLCYELWRGKLIWVLIFGLLTLWLVACALTKPLLLRIPSKVWWRFSHFLGWLNARIILFAIFFLVFTPIGVILRLTRWDPLLRRRRGMESGWRPYPTQQLNVRYYERMY